MDEVDKARARKLIGQKHFDLLRSFGRHKFQQQLPDAQKEQLWKVACDTAGIPYVPLELVTVEWRAMVGGVSERTKLVMASGPDPTYVSVGVLFDGKDLVASHTSTTQAVFKRVAFLFRACFSSDEQFLEAATSLLHAVVRPPKKKRRP